LFGKYAARAFIFFIEKGKRHSSRRLPFPFILFFSISHFSFSSFPHETDDF